MQRDGPGIFLDLKEVLAHLEPEARAWRWAIQIQPELTADPGWDFSHVELESQIAADPYGLTLSFDDLLRFGHRIDQVIWGEFIASNGVDSLPTRSTSAAEVGRTATAGICAFDSSYWLIGGPATMIDRLAQEFASVDELDPEEWPRDHV